MISSFQKEQSFTNQEFESLFLKKYRKFTTPKTSTDSVGLFRPPAVVFCFPLRRKKSQTWSPDVHIHAVALNLALRGSGSDGGDSQVSSVQVLLGPLAVVRLVASLQNGLLIKLLKGNQCTECVARNWALNLLKMQNLNKCNSLLILN